MDKHSAKRMAHGALAFRYALCALLYAFHPSIHVPLKIGEYQG